MKKIFGLILICSCLFVKAQSNGYTVGAYSLTQNPTDGNTVFFGTPIDSPTTGADLHKIFFRKSGTIEIAELFWKSTVAGTNENISMYVRKNNTSDFLVATIGDANATKVFSNTSINITFVSGDYVEIKMVYPTWVTNPTGVIIGGYLFVKPTP